MILIYFEGEDSAMKVHMGRTLIFLLSIILMVAGCSPSQSAIATAISQTQVYEGSIATAIQETLIASSPPTVTPSPPTTTPVPVSGNLIQYLDETTIKSEFGWRQFDSSPIPINSPFSISMKINGDGPWPAVVISGKLDTGEYGEGSHRMLVAPSGGIIEWELNDGVHPGSSFVFAFPPSIQPGNVFTISFLDNSGNSFDLLADDGKVVAHYKLKDIRGLEMPDGLFPDSQLFIGYLVSPNAELTIYELSLNTDYN